MAKYRAKVDTFYNYSYIRKGKEVYGGKDLADNEYFELIEDENKPVNNSADNGNGGENTPPAAPSKQMNYRELVKYAQELNIAGANRMNKPDLLAAIAEAEAAAAAPTANEEVKGDDNGEVDGDSVNEEPKE